MTLDSKERCVVYQQGADFNMTEAYKSKAVRFYRYISHNYNNFVELGIYKYFRQKERKIVLELSEFRAGYRMIDVGCGGGYYSLKAKEMGMHVTSLDINSSILKPLQGKVDETQLADIECLSISKTYDRVVCAGVLDFVSCPKTTLKNLFRMTSDRGKVIILTARKGPIGELYRIEKRLLGFDSNLFSLDWLKHFAEHHQMKFLNFDYPLPHNLVVAFEKQTPGD